jgi:hypothetical protein
LEAMNIDFINDTLDKDCTTTLVSIRNELMEKFEVGVSISTISKSIREFMYSFKRIALVPERINSKKIWI